MRIPSGVTDQYIYFVAVDATDLVTRETGLSSFTVRRSRNGGASAVYTTPTINETDSANMPGVYELLLDEDMTIDSGDHSQEVCLHITHSGMAPVTRVFELYRPDVTAGQTISVVSGEAWSVTRSVANDAITAAALASDAVAEIQSGLATSSALSTVAGYIDTEVAAILAAVDTEVAAIKAKTDNLPASPAAVGSAMTLTSGERTAIANEVEAQIIDDTDSEKVLTAITDKIASVNPSLEDLTLAAIASAVRTELTAELALIDAAISSRLAGSADGSGLTAIPWNAAWDAEVQSEAADALAAYDPPTRAEATADKEEILAAEIDANITSVNGVAVAGTGTNGDEWRPA